MENIEKKQQKVFVLVGPPAVGKSTWTIKQMAPKTDVWISRDNIRFMLLQDSEEYFAHEGKVKNIFFGAIRNNTFTSKDYDNVFIDATHLTPKSRRQTMNHIASDTYKIAVYFDVPIEVALERNARREGRARVPENAIRNMYNSFRAPKISEGFDEIWRVNAEGEIIEKYEEFRV
jgi:predicted kinase